MAAAVVAAVVDSLAATVEQSAAAMQERWQERLVSIHHLVKSRLVLPLGDATVSTSRLE
jgi:hypothetical protein